MRDSLFQNLQLSGLEKSALGYTCSYYSGQFCWFPRNKSTGLPSPTSLSARWMFACPQKPVTSSSRPFYKFLLLRTHPSPPLPCPFSNPSSPSYCLFIFWPSRRSHVLREVLLGLLTRLRTPAHPHHPSPYVSRLAHITPVSAHQTVHSGVGGGGWTPCLPVHLCVPNAQHRAWPLRHAKSLAE